MDPTLTRRALLGAGATAAGGLLVPRPVAHAARRRPALLRDVTFPSGVASGLPGQRSVSLWTRAGGAERSGALTLEVATDPDFRRIVDRRRVEALAEGDFTARVRLQSRRLRPDEQYWYRFESRDGSSPVGRFKTALPPDSRRPVRIAFFSCQRFEHGYFTPQHGIAEEDDLDLVVSLGDYVYDQDTTPRVRTDGTGSPNGHAETLDQWRAKHRLYRSDAGLQAMHAAHPFAAIWDDCEVEGNWAGDEENSAPGPERDRRIPFLDKRRNAFRAFFENMPLERFAGDRDRIYRALRLGANADLFLLDTRSYRDPQPCGSGTPGQPCLEAEIGERKRLGDTQKAWLKDGLVGSDAAWRILGNANMMMALDLPAGIPLQTDSWDGYGDERREVLEFARAKGVRDLTSIVGDVHVFFAGDLTTDGRVTGRPVGTEFVGASVSHDALDLSGDAERDAIVTERIQQANPHLKFANFRLHGYVVMEATPEALHVDFRAVRGVSSRTSETFTLQRFLVERGDPRVQVVGAPVQPPKPVPAPPLPPVTGPGGLPLP